MKKKATLTPTRKRKTAAAEAKNGVSASRLIDARIKELGDWRGKALARLRTLIKQACPDVVEEWKWNVPVWSRAAGGIICTGETYKSTVKFTFAKGASLPDPSQLFNASLDGKTRRALDLHEGDKMNEPAFQTLIRAAAGLNAGAAPSLKAASKRAGGAAEKPKTLRSAGSPAKKSAPAAPRLLSGGNPQIAKAEGDAPVQAYIGALPGWKSAVGRRLDAIIERTVPGVRKAVKWNSPLYGAAGQDVSGKAGSWFLGIHSFDKYIKVAFFRGGLLSPLPPVTSKQKDVRYLHIHEGDTFNEAQFAEWVSQASRLPGERM